MRFAVIAPLAIAALAASSCAKVDDEHFPYDMKGLNSWLYDPAAGQEYPAGFTEASYENRKSALRACAAQASNAAADRGLMEWSHVCCTVTEESQCATKVR